MEDLKKVLSPAPAGAEEKAAVTPANFAAPKAPAPVKRQYVGPQYKFGIVLPGTTTQLDPKRMTEAEIADLIERYPEAANWWK